MLLSLLWLAMPVLAQDAQPRNGPLEVTVEAAKAPAVAAPVFSPPPGAYPAPLAITLSTATAGATIYYTTNGSSPSRQKSPVYHGPIQLTALGKTTLKAFAYKKGLKASNVTSGIFTVSGPPPPPSETGGTLFLASLTPQGAATSSGSGSATLTLTQDQKAAVLRFSFSSLTGPITSEHIHAGDGTILFDLDTTPPQADGSRVWRIQPVGTFDTAKILAGMRGGELYLNLHTAAYPAGEIKGFFRQTNGSQTFTPPPPPPSLPGGIPTQDDAARFMFQATYGPRPGEVEVLQQKGFARFLDEQLAMPAASHLTTYDQLVGQLAAGEDPSPALVRESFASQAVQGPDQLRQRVVFALSELFVISDRDADVRKGPDGMAAYLDLLGQHAFGNFRELLEAVTLSPVMGVYLNMAGSSKSIPDQGLNPNENYAREILQLFSIGLYELHPDGTLRLDADNQPIPTYDQEVVKAFARAFTGWTYGGQNQRDPKRFLRPQRNYRIPMESWAAYHATDEKRLLDGNVLRAGQSAQADLEQALDVIFNHPNAGPFFCRFMIQRLVTGNPSPAYVYRCGQAFANNGTGTRGDMKAVLRAILLDYEARSATLAARPDEGHLREPVVRLTGLMRTLDAKPRNGRWRFLVQLDRQGQSTSETPLRAPTVFNFFEPSYALPGEIAQAGLVSPELQIATETTVVGAANLYRSLLGSPGRTGPYTFNLAAFQPPQAPTDEALLDRVDQMLFAGAMSDSTRTTLRNALADPDFPRAGDQRVLTLLWLASLTPESVVQK
ncbi:MAG: hypothetical protein QOF89_3797 [Acidobacteriota bacterium]|jgi:uncharacterized protein (DUF1800 family)|nr:hypothetical protein [Acidobacteriota bacterium]